jgi:hypothetical protein
MEEEHKKTMKNDSMSQKRREWNIKTIEKRKVFPVFHAASLFGDGSISPCGM